MTIEHRRAWDAIPWVVNDSAEPALRDAVLAHAAGCAECRDELAFHRSLHAGCQAEDADHDAQPALARLLTRIEAEDGPVRPPRIATAPRWARWLVAAALLQSVGLTLLAARVWQQPAPYETLSSSPQTAAGARIRFVPAPGLRVAEMQALLDRAGLRVLAVSDAGVYALAPRDAGAFDRAHTLALLRADAGVLLAEPIAAP